MSKFVSMIEELIESRSSSLKLTDWDTPAAAGGGGGGSAGGGAGKGGDPCQFTVDVRKAVSTMHNILQQQLPPEQLQVTYITSATTIACITRGCFFYGAWCAAAFVYSLEEGALILRAASGQQWC